MPDALLREPLPADDEPAARGSLAPALYVAMTRARGRLVLAYPAAGERGARSRPAPIIEAARAALGAEWEEPRGGAVRPGGDAALDVPTAARRAARGDDARRRPARRAALRHRPRRLARGRALPRAAQAGGADRAARRGKGSPTRSATSTPGSSRPSPPSSARSSPPRRSTTTCSTPSATTAAAPRPPPRARSPRSSLPPQAGRRTRAFGFRHRHLPDVSSEVQVRPRLPDPPGADDPSALRDPRASGARAFPRGDGRGR